MKHLYLHVPFCQNICYYCDFKRGIYQKELVDKWLKKIIEEITTKQLEDTLETIYIGGGTPSCLHAIQLKQLLNALQPYSKTIKEFTLEANVESLSDSILKIINEYGVNRISLGVQSFNDMLLKEMNRKHTKNQILDALQRMEASGIHNISIDLIYGFENQTLAMWKQDLEIAVSLPHIKHISIYSLTIEENSVFAKQNKSTCDNELEGQMYEFAITFLENHGFKQYEVANFAREHYESQHNIGYWRYNDFYGIGVGASGKENNVRYEHVSSIQEYVNGLDTLDVVTLSKEELMFEQVMMSLRMRQGIDENLFLKRYGCSIWDVYSTALQECIKAQDIVYKKPYLSCSIQGMLHLHDVLIKFMR